MSKGFTNNGHDNSSGLLIYDYASKKLTNNTVSLASIDNGVVQFGRMVFVPNFGPSGIVVSVGGAQIGNTNQLLSMDSVHIFDPASGKWYDQEVTGDIPSARQEYCLTGVASENSTYEIFLYAGWASSLGAKAAPYDSAYVLTLPGFNWIRASYPYNNPRHALSCESVGGGQILTIGGLDTTVFDSSNTYQGPFETPDPFTNGLGVFDISSLTWKDSYVANQTVYTPSSQVLNFYESQ